MTLKWSIERRTTDLGTRVPEFQPLKYISYEPMIQPILLRILLPQNRRLWPAYTNNNWRNVQLAHSLRASSLLLNHQNQPLQLAVLQPGTGENSHEVRKIRGTNRNAESPPYDALEFRHHWMEKRNDHMTHASSNGELFIFFNRCCYFN